MRISFSLLFLVLFTVFELVTAEKAKVWNFKDATVSIRNKGAGVDQAQATESFALNKPLGGFLDLDPNNILRIALTATEDGKPARPHQLMLAIREAHSGTEESYAFKVTTDGQAELELMQKDLPLQHLLSTRSLVARIQIGAFGHAQSVHSYAFFLNVKRDESAPLPIPSKPIRYGKQPEIHHTFKDDPKSPPVFITAFVSLFIVAALPVLAGAWLTIGLNLNGSFDAFNTSPAAHGLFAGGIMAMEAIFFMYYLSWSLFRTLPVAAAVGAVTFLSGSRALSEVQARRLAGKR